MPILQAPRQLRSGTEYWARSATDVLLEHDVHAEEGLSGAQVAQRLAEYGPNELRARKGRSKLRILYDQLKSTVVVLLVVAAVLSFAFGGSNEGVAIVAVILINTGIGFIVELRAVRSMEALRSLGSVHARVRREGKSAMVPAQEVVPGDILVLEAGDTVTADARLVHASRLRANESTFTGESVPVDKHIEPIEGAKRLDQRHNMLFRGTSLTMGSCEAIVVATGMQTALGQISELAERSSQQPGGEITPLEKQLATVGNKLIALTVVIVVVVVALGVLAGKPWTLMIEAGVALAVATIPEGLPVVATIALARGLWRMSKRNALINKLSAVETLGATSVLCTDKTGTLTENRMVLSRIGLDSGALDWTQVFLEPGGPEPLPPDLFAALEIGVLCNHASLGGALDTSKAVGDPMEIALLVAGLRADLQHGPLLRDSPEVGGEAFDASTKMMATYHTRSGGILVAVKGAPEAVIPCCTHLWGAKVSETLNREQRASWLARGEQFARDGLRVIAVARKQCADSPLTPYEGLTLVGLLGLLDPPRLEVRSAIKACQDAGIRVLMITGDHPSTAGAIARAVGLEQSPSPGELPRVETGSSVEELDTMLATEREHLSKQNIFARVSPAQKLNLIRLHQEAGSLVGMVGDGVNDAPALEQADIGIAMGLRGTQVAREASEMVLRDDSFASIVAAVEQGRVIFGNIRLFVVYLLSCNLSEVMVLGIASSLKVPLPILPLQILFLNLVSDIFPALALGVGSGSKSVMRRPPRDPSEGILTRGHIAWIAVFGLLITASVLGVFFVCLGPLELSPDRAVTVSFLTLAFAQLWHVFNMREPGSPFFRNEITRNPFVWGALLLCTLLLLVAVYIPVIAELLELSPPNPREWLLIGVFSILPLLIGQFASLQSGRNRENAQ